MANHLRDLLLSAFDYYAQRTKDRFKGLTDEEYFWEPVEGCWSVRKTDEGYVTDWEWPTPDPAPVTTMAWRLVHIISFLTEHGLRAVAFEGGEANWIAPTVIPASANAALYHLDHAIEAWKRDLTAIDDERLWEPMGPEAGQYAKEPVAGFVGHIHDEFIHHAAEVSLLRDLYRAGHSASAD